MKIKAPHRSSSSSENDIKVEEDFKSMIKRRNNASSFVENDINIRENVKLQDLSSISLETRRRHIENTYLSRNTDAYKCFKCKKILPSSSHLYRHSKTCFSPKSFEFFFCDHCVYETNQKDHLRNHIEKNHLPRNSDVSKCFKCKKNFSSRSSSDHSKKCGFSETTEISSSDHCENKTNRKKRLRKRNDRNHSSRKTGPYKCFKCGTKTSNSKNLHRHYITCCTREINKRFTCDHCGYGANRKDYVRRHIEKTHLPRDPDTCKCSKCKKFFSTSWSLTAHLKMCGSSARNSFRNRISYECSECWKKFSTSSHLSRHLKNCRFPEKAKIFSCDHCGYGTNRKDHLRRHIINKH